MRQVGEIHNDCSSHLYLKQQLFGGSGLETLTEVENEDEFSKGSSPSTDTDNYTNCGSGSSNGTSSGDVIVVSRSRASSHRSCENILLLEDDGCTADVDCDDEVEDLEEHCIGRMKYFGHSSLPSSLNTISNLTAASHGTLHFQVNDTVTKCQSCAKILSLKIAKTSDLEKTIQQLRDELKECRDQNELLEFRLLEIQEFGVTPNDEFGRVGNESKSVEELIETNDQVGVRRNNSNRKGVEYGPEVTSEEVMIQSEYQNNHASVSESRSSCSDCSESLSFQESGIFDSQFSEESCPPPNSISLTSRESVVSDASTELAILSSQIENLILRLNNPPHTNANNESAACNDKCDEIVTSRKVGKSRLVSIVNGGSRMKGKDLKDSGICLELQSCRKQVQELEKRITPYLNNTCIKTLQDKIRVLDQENRRLEEERCEMEEAENDSRNQCQRLDETLRQLRDRNIVLQREISREKAFVEQLSFQMEEVQEKHNHAISQLNRLDCLVQNYEQQNFELEESNIELKTSTKFLVEFWPLFELARYLWSLWRSNEGAASDQQNLGHIQKRNHVTLLQSRQFAKSPLFGPAAPQRRRKLPKLPSSSTASITHPTKVTSQQNEISPFMRNSCSVSTQTMELPSRENDKNDGVMITLVEQSNQQFNERNNVLASMRERSESHAREQEQNISEYRKVSEMEKIEIIEKYERMLANAKQESNDKSEHSRRELVNLRESWHSLIQELEQACSSLNLSTENRAAASTPQIPAKVLFESNALRKSTTPSNNANTEVESAKTLGTKITATNKIKDGSLVANRIQALFPNELRAETRVCGSEKNCVKNDSVSFKPPIKQKPDVSQMRNKISAEGLSRNLVCCFNELKEKFESRESALLNQIDQLKQQKISEQDSIKTKHHVRNAECIHPTEEREESRRIVHLLEEKNRLESILSDQEKVWSKLKDAEEENERLAAELNSTTAMLKRKLNDSLCIEKDLQIRIEELEMSECSSKEQLSKRDAKIWKLSQEIKRLKEDCEFYHSKSCHLQSDLDDRVEEVMKFKNEIQQLSAKLKTSEQMLHDKEQAFEATETTFESQISKLQTHLSTLQQELCDSECTSGMLREEVSYLERTLQAALEKNNQSEDEMKVLTCRMQEKVQSLDELKRECCCSGMKDGQVQVMGAINDLDVFAKNEGGLVGMTRDINEIQKVVQRCSQCGDAGKMLTEVSQQLNTLTLMLGGSQAGTRVFMSPEEQNFLTRCESDENITTTRSTTGAGGSQQEFLNEVSSCHSVIEENKMLHTHLVQLTTELNAKDQEIERLQRSISSLGIELSELEKEFLARKNDLKESHLNELIWWKLRCQEKNDLIHLLARRIAQLSVSDSYGFFMDGILKEIQQIRDENYSTKQHRMKSKSEDEASPQDCNSLLTYFNNERRRLTEMLNSSADVDKHPSTSKNIPLSPAQAMDFRVLRRLSEDSILVSWTIPGNVSIPTGLVDGYEISVNGNIFLRIPKPSRFKAILFGLDMSEPLELCLRCTGAYNAMHESCITFIA